jgi:hypothetical protein
MEKLELLDSSTSPSPHGSFSKDSRSMHLSASSLPKDTMHTSSRQGKHGLGQLLQLLKGTAPVGQPSSTPPGLHDFPQAGSKDKKERGELVPRGNQSGGEFQDHFSNCFSVDSKGMEGFSTPNSQRLSIHS